MELCGNNFDEVLEHILGFGMRSALQWERVMSLVENSRAAHKYILFSILRNAVKSSQVD